VHAEHCLVSVWSLVRALHPAQADHLVQAIIRTGTDGTTVQDVTYELLRAHGLTTIFGNLGSTEETFPANFPADFRYVLGPQEASALDIPGLDIVSIARGHGCEAARVADLDALKQAAVAAWTKAVPTVLEIPISAQVPPLV
jgi:thiamine pyrophosphate-dependent acetolactate synthase large subunit-like protein